MRSSRFFSKSLPQLCSEDIVQGSNAVALPDEHPTHEPIELGAFLIAAGNGPEKQEVLRLIGTPGLGDRGPASSEVSVNAKTFDYVLGETPNTLFPSNLDRREGTCLESAVDLLIPRPS
jgi:hypothetical protein